MKDKAIIPEKVVVNRGFTSLTKIGNQLVPFPFNLALHSFAQFNEWNADSEGEMKNFFMNLSKDEKKMRQLFLIEAKFDHYFSGKGGFDETLHQDLREKDVQVFRGQFYPVPYHTRSHHALPLDHLKKNSVSAVDEDNRDLKMNENENVSDYLTRSLFCNPNKNEQKHTCLYVAGNEANLDLGSMRDIFPMLRSIIKQMTGK